MNKVADSSPDSKQPDQSHPAMESVDLKHSSLYVNRETSWLEFNHRVLEEALDPETPLLEKLKFLSIFSSNLDEFFMIRVAGLRKLQSAGISDPSAGDQDPRFQIEMISRKVRDCISIQYRCLQNDVIPNLKCIGIQFLTVNDLTPGERRDLKSRFMSHILPVLTPLAVDAGHPFPFLGNLRTNLYVSFSGPDDTESENSPYAFIEIPGVLPRLIEVDRGPETQCLVYLEDIIESHLDYLFPGMKVRESYRFRVTRDLDYDLHENEVMDLLQSVEAELKDRMHQNAVRIEIESNAPGHVESCLCRALSLPAELVFRIDGPLNICSLMKIYDFPAPPMFRDPPFNPRIPPRLAADRDIFSVIREGDILLHHPFDSFAVVAEFMFAAAEDPNVMAIKQTLYRTGKDSPVIAALIRAAENGKQVTAVMELKARFDEASNIEWAKKMQDAGINLVYGFVRWKVHCKATLIVRKEGNDLIRYVHVSTGNYNSTTARIYTDLGLITCSPDFGHDVSSLFNVITGFNSWTGHEMFKPETVTPMFRKFLLAPVNMELRLIEFIEREIACAIDGKPGRIIAKMNALTEPKLIRALYRASQAGVKIDLIVRGICCLRPGIPGVSEHITVTSIVDRFLEHTRIYYFHNGGNPEIYSGSADWMPRNLSRRVEILYPIESTVIKTRIIKEILGTYLKDNVKSRRMVSTGAYSRVRPSPDKRIIRSQSQLIAIARKGGVKSAPYDEVVKKFGQRKQKKQR